MEIDVSLFTTEEAAILERGALRLFGGTTRSSYDPLALPANEWQCAHIDVSYEQKEGAAQGTTIPVYNLCNNRIMLAPDGAYEAGFLCAYHDRVLLTKRLTPAQLTSINAKLAEGHQDSLVEGVIKTDAREIKRFPVKRFNGLRIHMSPQVPELARPILVNPEWEKVVLNG